MPNPKYTDITFLVDRSGSMESIALPTIEGIRGVLSDLQGQDEKEGLKCRVSIVEFDCYSWTHDSFELTVIADAVPVKEALCSLILKPRGNTPLREAICKQIDATGARLARLPESERPGVVIFVIATDGYENASRPEFLGDAVKKRIQHQEQTYGWQFMYIGANQDAIKVGADLGIKAASSMTYNATDHNTRKSYESLSPKFMGLRSAVSCIAADSPNYEQEVRTAGGINMTFNDTDRDAAVKP